MTTIIFRFPPSQVRKLAESQGLSYEDTLKELNSGSLTLPARLPLSPEEEQQSFEDELIECLTEPITDPPWWQTF
jgi:hypothetical protein